VVDDAAAYDYPARYRVDDPEVGEILVFTHTYVGQAVRGEAIEAAGQLEEEASGRLRLVIGSSREAPGEYLRVERQVSTNGLV
jgi:predicted nucleotidyltransferase